MQACFLPKTEPFDWPLWPRSVVRHYNVILLSMDRTQFGKLQAPPGFTLLAPGFTQSLSCDTCRRYGKTASREAFEHSVLLESADIDAESLAQPHAYVDLRPFMDQSPPSVRSGLGSFVCRDACASYIRFQRPEPHLTPDLRGLTSYAAGCQRSRTHSPPAAWLDSL